MNSTTKESIINQKIKNKQFRNGLTEAPKQVDKSESISSLVREEQQIESPQIDESRPKRLRKKPQMKPFAYQPSQTVTNQSGPQFRVSKPVDKNNQNQKKVRKQRQTQVPDHFQNHVLHAKTTPVECTTLYYNTEKNTLNTYHSVLNSIGNDPAIVNKQTGLKKWYNNGKLHRENGPAVITEKGDEFWYIDDKLHREDDQPAMIFKNGRKEWYNHGKLHRESGPAVVSHNGDQEFWINGEKQ